MRFVIIIIIVALLALIGLYAYSLTIEPETRVIEQDAVIGSADA